MWKPTKNENPDFRCNCGSNEIVYRIVEDDDCHEDYQYKCDCGRTWWAEGVDY